MERSLFWPLAIVFVTFAQEKRDATETPPAGPSSQLVTRIHKYFYSSNVKLCWNLFSTAVFIVLDLHQQRRRTVFTVHSEDTVKTLSSLYTQ